MISTLIHYRKHPLAELLTQNLVPKYSKVTYLLEHTMEALPKTT